MRVLPRIADSITGENERAAFEQSWRLLAPNLEQARTVKSEAAASPEVLHEPGKQALFRWLEAFERQLVALERFHEAAANPGLDLPVDDVRLARSRADELFNTLQETRNLLGAAPAISDSRAAS
jgi:hypothetical protein